MADGRARNCRSCAARVARAASRRAVAQRAVDAPLSARVAGRIGDAHPPHPRSRPAAAERLHLPHARDPEGADARAGWEVAAVTGPRHGARDAADGDGRRARLPPHRRAGAGAARRSANGARSRAFARRDRRGRSTTFRPDMLHAHSPVLDALAALRVARRREAAVGLRDPRLLGGCRGRQRHRDARARCDYRATRALETLRGAARPMRSR